jgi:hypothetical protein
MKMHKSYIVVGLIIAFSLFFELAANADESLQQTEITFSQPISIPGQTLPAGTYLFKQANVDDLNLIQIFSSDRIHLYATLQTIPTEANQIPDDTTVRLAEQGAGKPYLLLKWFYPGEQTGHEFVYSNQVESQIAQDRQQTVMGNQPTTGTEAGGSN